MDLSKLSIEFIDGHERTVFQDGLTQVNKILPYMTVVYPYQGYYEVCLENGPLTRLSHGEGCFITAPGTRHTIVHRITPGEDRMIPRWLRFSVLYDHVMDVTAWFSPPLIVKDSQAEPFIEAVDELLKLKQLPEHIQNFRKMFVAGFLLEHLLDVSAYQPIALEMERIYPAITLIKDHYSEVITAQHLSDACAMSPATFYRLFYQTIHKTPMQYLEEYRLKQAARYLLSDADTLAAIADKCGYYDEFHLSRNFKKYYGISPREYKKRTIL